MIAIMDMSSLLQGMPLRLLAHPNGPSIMQGESTEQEGGVHDPGNRYLFALELRN